jgi:AraC-like DNA-binding protein
MNSLAGDPHGILKGSFGRISVMSLGRPLAAHAHPEFNLLIKLSGEDTTFRSERSDFQLKESGSLFFNRWQPHRKLENRRDATLFLSLLINPNWLVASDRSSCLRIDNLSAGRTAELPSDAMISADQLARIVVSSVATVDGRVEAMISELVSSVVSTHASVQSNALVMPKAVDARIMRATKLLRAYGREIKTFDVLARQVGLSRSRFFQQFKNCVGASPQQYIDWITVAAAIDLLTETKISLQQLASRVGFDQHTLFSRFFVQHTGMTPRAFRRLVRVVPDPSPAG